MNRLIRFLGFTLTVIMMLYSPSVNAEKHEFVIIDKVASAPVRKQPNRTSSLGRLPAGNKVQIYEKKTVRSGSLLVIWYRVKINGKDGLIFPRKSGHNEELVVV
ncbi:MAG: hypothetical protein U9Q24_01320 [Candidatus Ratteibacteria bacterium]|nr:hypothetical protein [Candidatus Ratteibacteria bacterium]